MKKAKLNCVNKFNYIYKYISQQAKLKFCLVITIISIIGLLNVGNYGIYWDERAEINMVEYNFKLIKNIFFFVFSFSIAQLGIRYILMIFPFLFVFCSRVTLGWTALKNRYKIFVFTLITYLLFSNLSYFPHYISYFNELLVDRKMGYTILADSNLDWGQNWVYLEKYLQKNPNARYMQYFRENNKLRLFEKRLWDEVELEKFKGGFVVVQANQLVGVINDSEVFQYLRKNKKPIDHIGYSYLIFEIQPSDLDKILTDISSLDS